jgi:hypothetical protein
MNKLKEKIEERIKFAKKYIDDIERKDKNDIYINVMVKQFNTLHWILSEVEKMNCDNCQHNKDCLKTLKTFDDPIYKKINYCSEFEDKNDEV